jgi:20S proteasome alpha/beta subunit
VQAAHNVCLCSLEEHLADDDAKLTAPEIHSYLSRLAYNRRNKMNPFFNRLVTAGWKDGISHVGYVDLYGTTFTDDYVATGFGTHLALPIIRSRWRADLSEGEARGLLEDCMRVLWYRDARALNKIQLAKVRPHPPFRRLYSSLDSVLIPCRSQRMAPSSVSHMHWRQSGISNPS